MTRYTALILPRDLTHTRVCHSLPGASHAQHADGTSTNKAADTWPYENPPWDLGLDITYFFVGLRQINGSHPPDNVPDPNVTFSKAPYNIPSFFAIARYTSSPWGPWDQVGPFKPHQ
jgi:hypothetical protein